DHFQFQDQPRCVTAATPPARKYALTARLLFSTPDREFESSVSLSRTNSVRAQLISACLLPTFIGITFRAFLFLCLPTTTKTKSRFSVTMEQAAVCARFSRVRWQPPSFLSRFTSSEEHTSQ